MGRAIGPTDRACVLGSGITAQVVAGELSRRGLDVTWIETGSSVSGGSKILPILPPENALDRDWSEYPTVDFELVNEHRIGPRLPAQRDSLGWALRSNLGVDEIRDVLTEKLFGPEHRREAMPEVWRKIDRQYNGHRLPAERRIGFRAEQNAYSHAYAGDAEAVERRTEALEAVRFSGDGEVEIGGQRHRFGLIVVTTPLREWCDLLGWTCPQELAAPARLFLGEDSNGDRRNHVIYDLDPESPIYRIFWSDGPLTLVQGARHCSERQVREHVAKEWPSVEIHRERTLTNAYPVRVEDPEEVSRLAREAYRRFRILPFGRLATWRYIDIHENPWHRLPHPRPGGATPTS